MRSPTHKVTFTFILDECEGDPEATLNEIGDLMFNLNNGNHVAVGRVFRGLVRASAQEVDAYDGGPCMWDTSSTGTNTDYTWDVAFTSG